ncbi:MAG TPA: hypothetical protein VFA32_25395 [Dehalococcoidia bacterium]|nr:hypothetical protein [Dehalococcoidia bacterium]
MIEGPDNGVGIPKVAKNFVAAFRVDSEVLAKALGVDNITLCDDLPEIFIRMMLHTGGPVPADYLIQLAHDGDPGLAAIVLDGPG